MTREGAPIDISTSAGSVEIRLPENPTTGYEWELDLPQGVHLVHDNYVDDAASMVGGGGERVFVIGVDRGAWRAEARLRRPWEGEPLEVRAISLRRT